MEYYLLVTRTDRESAWSVAFGDGRRDTVVKELEGRIGSGDTSHENARVVDCADGTQATADRITSGLNQFIRYPAGSYNSDCDPREH